MRNQFVSTKSSLAILTLIYAAFYVANAYFTNADKTAFVVSHNRLRESAFPSASNMLFMTWDVNLERLAVAAAQKCIFEHSSGAEYTKLGENIYMGFRTDPHEITLMWFSEKGNYNEALNKCDGCGHYTQVMTAGVNNVGCGIKRDCKPGSHMVFCEYSTGNSYFVRGPACSACPASMPLCLNGLCVSKEMATNAVMKVLDSTVATAADFKCRLICKNCGKLINDASTNVCRCDCAGAGGTGDLCETKSASSVTCSACTGSPPCLNSGTEDTSDPLKCKCKCPTGFLGNKCETPQGQFDNSVKLVFSAANEFRFATFVVLPPVSRSLFNSKIWAILQTELSKAVNKFCRTDAASYVKCCPAKTFPADPSSIATAEHVKATDFGFIDSSVGYTFESFNLLIFATVTSTSQLCAPAAGAASPAYLPPLALQPAIQSAQATINAQLTTCCGNTALKHAISADLSALTDPMGPPIRFNAPASTGTITKSKTGVEISARPYKYLHVWLLLIQSVVIWR